MQLGSLAFSGSFNTSIASASVATGTIFILFPPLPAPIWSGLFISWQLLIGVKNRSTPSFFAPIIFSAIPPIGPTSPSVVIVPVPAIFRELNPLELTSQRYQVQKLSHHLVHQFHLALSAHQKGNQIAPEYLYQ